MKKSKILQSEPTDNETTLQNLVNGSEKEDLVQCIRLISIYVSIYKKHYGELPAEFYEDLFLPDGINSSSMDIFDNGLKEAIDMLDMIIKTSPKMLPYNQGSVTIN